MDKTIIASFTLFLLFDQFQALHHQSRTTIHLRNNCEYEVWPAIMSFDGGKDLTLDHSLESGSATTILVHNNWSGYVWARTGCTNHHGKFKCESGDCETTDHMQINCNNNEGAHPFTMAYFYFNGMNRKVTYSTDLTFGFNVPLEITPDDNRCKISSCPANINNHCPDVFKKISKKKAVGCYNNRVTSDSAEFLKARCPQAYVLLNDGMPMCTMDTRYTVTFCPSLD